MPGIGIGISPVFGRGGGQSYWTSRYPSGLKIVTTTSDTQITVTHTNNGIQDYDLIRYELSTDNVIFVENTTAAAGTTSKTITGLTAGILYFIRLRYSKGTEYSAYTESISIKISTLLTSLKAFWKFDEASGDAADSLGVYTLTNNNTATYAAAVINNGVSLGTANANKSLTVDNAFGMTYASARSISCWVNINSAPADGVTFTLFSLIFATNPGNYTFAGYKRTGTGYLVINRTTETAKTLTVGTWYHFCVTHDHSANEVKLYIDGLLISTATSFTSDYSAQTSRLAVGRLLTVNYSSAAYDDLSLYNKVLTLTEINEIYGKTYPFYNHDDVALDLSAYCWFNSAKALYNATANKTWVGVAHNDNTGYSQHILTMDNATGIASAVKVGTVVECDDHNEPSVLIRSSDNKLFIAYSEHSAPNGILIRHRISTNALDASAWGAEATEDPSGTSTYTYCNAFEVANGDIYIFFRETDGVDAWWNFIKSTDGGATFGDDTRFVHRDYLRCWQNPTDKDIIHFAASHHPNSLGDPNYVFHFYFDAGAGTWHKSDGTDVTANLPLEVANGTIIFQNADPDQGWIEDLFLDSNGYPRVLMSFYPDIDVTPALKFLYYSEWTGVAWSAPYEIHQALDHNIGTVTLVNTYQPLASFDRSNPNRIFASKEVSGICEIFEITRIAANSFTSVQKTFNSVADQWRPFTTASPNKNVFWLNKICYYSYLSGFNEQLVCKTL